jgi:hypothetical protein
MGTEIFVGMCCLHRGGCGGCGDPGKLGELERNKDFGVFLL